MIQLLTEIKAIKNRYEEIAKRTGENFNVFRILNLQANEIRLHSTFLAEFLKPYGTHGQGHIFMQLFKETIIDEICNNWEFDCNSAKVKTESHVGKITDESESGGRIDLFITDKNKRRIIIENKIYAPNQKNQLLRYHNHDKNALLFYLNLNGKVDEDFDKKVAPKLEEGKDYYIISYKEHIIDWLSFCLKESALLPNIREILSQYIHLIKILTHQSTNNAMENEIMQLIVSKPELFDSVEQLHKSYERLKKKIRNNLFNELDKKLSNEEYSTRLKTKNYQLILTADESEKFGFIFSYRIIKNDLKYRTRLWENDKGKSKQNRRFSKALVQRNDDEVMFEKLSELIKVKFPNSDSTNSSLIYFKPSQFKDKKHLKDLDASDYLNIYNDDFCVDFVDSMISEIKIKDETIRKEIKELEL